MKRLVTAGLVLAAMAMPAMAIEYRSPIFKDGGSRLAVAFMCGVVGQKTGIAPDAMVVVAKSVGDQLSADMSGDVMADALDWWDAEGKDLSAQEFWAKFCAQPIDNLRRLMTP